MLFHVLGPLQVHDGTVHQLGASKRARLLTALLLQPNTWVAVDQLVGATWQEQAVPPAARRPGENHHVRRRVA